MRLLKGTTLIELLVVLIIGLMILLAVGAVSDIGKRSQNKLIVEASIYNDISYGFKLIQRKVHGVGLVPPDNTVVNGWVGSRLVVGSEAFGVYTHSGGSDFVHLPDRFDLNDRKTILSVLTSDTLSFTPLVDPNIGNVDITLWGTKSGIPFNMTTYVKSRR